MIWLLFLLLLAIGIGGVAFAVWAFEEIKKLRREVKWLEGDMKKIKDRLRELERPDAEDSTDDDEKNA